MQVPIPDDWDGVSWCNWAVCWPDSVQWQGVLAGVLTLPARGRFWDAGSGSILAVQDVGRQIRDNNLPLETCIMGCNDSGISEALTAIALAVRSSGGGVSCCQDVLIQQGGGVVGAYTDPTSGELPIYGSVPPMSVVPGQFPAAFDSLAEYQTDKCEQANLIVSGVIGSLRGLGALGVFNFVALAGLIVLAIASAITFPPALIPVAAAALGFLATEVTLLALAADEIEANRDAWVCALYEADSVQEALGAIAELIDLVVVGISVSGPVAVAVKIIVSVLFNSDTLNGLFSRVSHLVYDGADCSACAGDCGDVFYSIEFGEVTGGSLEACGATVVSESAEIGCNRFDVSIWEDDTLAVRASKTLVDFTPSTTLTGAGAGCAGTPIYRLYDTSLSLIYSSATPPTGPIVFSAMSVVASQAGFHLDIVLE